MSMTGGILLFLGGIALIVLAWAALAFLVWLGVARFCDLMGDAP